MQPHQEQVVEEKQELDKKLSKLLAFCFGVPNRAFHNLPVQDQTLLVEQYNVMVKYSALLEKRIARFGDVTS